MTTKKTLSISRLVVTRDEDVVYDESFHHGINIIRGENSSGKSTIISFLYYALGGENLKWTDEQKICSLVYIDLDIGGESYCLCREIKDDKKASILMHDGTYASLPPSPKWLMFSRTRSPAKKSFSEKFFELLGLPQHKSDRDANLTMNQLLRLMYFDQATPPEKVLQPDEEYDNKELRRAIGEFLLGLDNLEARSLRQRLTHLNKELGKVRGEKRAIRGFLGDKADQISVDQVVQEISRKEEEVAEGNASLAELDSVNVSTTSNENKELANRLRGQIDNLLQRIDLNKRDSAELKHEIVDNKLFLETVDSKLQALQQSSVTQEVLNDSMFRFCPLCLEPLNSHVEEGHCALCKCETQLEKGQGYLNMSAELEFQRKETITLIERQEQSLTQNERDLPYLERELAQLQEHYRSFETSASPIRAKALAIAKKIGRLESELISLKQHERWARKLAQFDGAQRTYQKEIDEILDKLELLEQMNVDRNTAVRDNIRETVLSLVKGGGYTEKSFSDPKDFYFDFAQNGYSFDNRERVSGSSFAVLRTTFGLAILIEAVRDKLIRLPNFMIIDSMEDKGMTPERSRKVQRVIVEQCEEFKSDFQLIFTTTMIAPELEGSEYCVGRAYTELEPSLEL